MTRTLLLAGLLAGATSSGLAAQATISTESQATGAISSTSNTGGQTFVTPDANNTVLQSFRLGFGTYPESREYVARLVQWLPGTLQITGPTLFQSAVGTTTANTISTYVTFDVGGIALDPNATYLFFLSFAGTGGLNFTTSELYSNPNPYSSGSTFLAFHNLFASPDVATTWYESFSNLGGVDMGFTAQFTPNASVVPEPASLALVGTGLAGLLGARRRRRRREPEADA